MELIDIGLVVLGGLLVLVVLGMCVVFVVGFVGMVGLIWIFWVKKGMDFEDFGWVVMVVVKIVG